MTNNQDFYNELSEAAKQAGERVWQMPVDNSFRPSSSHCFSSYTSTSTPNADNSSLAILASVSGYKYSALSLTKSRAKNIPL